MSDKIIKEKAEEIYQKFNIPIQENPERFEVWEVPPLKDGMIIFFESG